MRTNLFAIAASLLMLLGSSATATASGGSSEKESDVITLDKDAFVNQVFDYENNSEWKYKGDKPAIIDFYADWCGPCKKLSPLLEELQSDYNGKIQVYKVDTEKSKELAATFGIQSLPTIVFVPMNEEPQAVLGFVPKEKLTEMVSNILKVEQ
ncbi:MAG: thioredoxin [Marinilabiliaceae bacterium]